MMKKKLTWILWALKILIGSALFALGFALFLEPKNLNAGGLSGLSMVLCHILHIDEVGVVTLLLNLPLFAIGGVKIGKKFFFGSLIGMASSSLLLDIFSILPKPEIEPLLSALYGGVLCGIGIGLVFGEGASTGGSDIIVRLLKRKWQHVPIGMINTCFDAVVVTLTGLVFWNVSSALYSGVTIFVTGQIIDAVVYRFDYSKVAMIITQKYDAIAEKISLELDRGATFLYGEGTYSHQNTKVVLTAVRQQQLADLKRLVVEIDPNAFIIVQEAHQVLGDGFSRYSKDAL